MPVEGDKIFTQDDKCGKLLNAFLSNLVKNLKILEFKEVNHFVEEISHPTF